MSFRIENILKKDTSYSDYKIEEDKELHRVEERLKPLEKDDFSILHQTLLKKTHASYCRSSTEYCKEDKACLNYQTYGSGKLWFTPQSYYNPYLEKDYPHIYTRCKLYPIYNTAYPTIFPVQYTYYSKRKGGQVRFTANQTDVLEKRFLTHKYLSPEERKLLADSLKLSDRQVKTWFQNRRAKWRRSNSTSSETLIDSDKMTEKHKEIKTISRC